VHDRERPLRRDLVVGFGRTTLRLAASATVAMVAAVKRRPGTHNARRRQLQGLVARGLYQSYEGDLDQREFAREIRRDALVVAALDRMWPVLTSEELLHDLFGAPALINLAARRVLDNEERRLLQRPRSPSLDDVAWTPADLPLLDEGRALLGPTRPRRDDEGVRAYGHIVVDEAQDLSPMALRMLARRSISGSMTLVGDIGQATTLLAPRGWEDVFAHLPSRRPARVTTLTVNYRTPAEVMTVAGEVLAGADVHGIAPPRSVRSIGRLPAVHHLAPGDLAGALAATAADELDAVGDGTVAVIAPASALRLAARALAATDLPWGEPDRHGLTAPITLLGLEMAKGLEFDAVVVVEPAALVDESPQGLRALFVALTRTTRRLSILHSDPLPPALQRGLDLARGQWAEAPVA